MKIRTIKSIISDFLTVLNFVEKKNKLKYLFLQIHIFFSSILETLSIFTIIPIIESLNNSSDSRFLKFLENYIEFKYLNPTYLILSFCLFLTLSNLYQIIIKKKIIDFGYVLMLELQKKVFKKIIHNKYEFFINKDIAYFNNVILHETQRIKGGFIESSLFILSQILLVTFTFVGLIIYDYKITIFIILILFIFYLVYLFLVSDRLLKVSKLNTKFKKDTIQYLNDIFSVIKTLVFKKNKSKFYEKLENILIQNYKANKFEQIISAIIKNSFEIYFLIIIISILFFTKNQLQVNSLLSYSVFAFAAYKIIPSFHLIYSHIIAFLGSSNPLKIVAAELLNKNLYPEIIKDNLLINRVKLNNVSFSYDKNKNVLNNVNYELQENKIVGICGKSGSGKTTFLDIVSGLMTPTNGEILINEKNYEDSSQLLISNSAYCSQKTILIDDTIENNICLETDNNINKNLLAKAIKIAELEVFIKNLKNGIHTIIGEEGIRVSGGEAQRINIARTIYLNRKFIFFDESLNNLDMITSNKILQNFKELDDLKTIFFITHDLRLLSDFEEVLVFNDGNLVENGSFSKLKSESKLFMELLDNPTKST